MKKIQGVIFDWAGTTVDYGCFAPLEVFMEVFRNADIELTYEEARKPMGLLKRDHIKALLEMERINGLWVEKNGKAWTEEDIDVLYKNFEESLFKTLADFTTPVPGFLDLIKELRAQNIKIGSTTGYTKEMLDIVAENAAKKGYTPDFRITASEVEAGRPHPYMIQANLKKLEITDLETVIKVGDTISDVKEGVNANVWSVGVLKGGSELGLSEEDVKNIDSVELEKLMEVARDRMIKAGADYVIEEIGALTEVIEDINKRLNSVEGVN